jgi:hypothetical protein
MSAKNHAEMLIEKRVYAMEKSEQVLHIEPVWFNIRADVSLDNCWAVS